MSESSIYELEKAPYMSDPVKGFKGFIHHMVLFMSAWQHIYEVTGIWAAYGLSPV